MKTETQLKQLYAYAKEVGVTLEIEKPIAQNKLSSLWYDGLMATLRYKDATFEVRAEGEVRATLNDKQGEEIASIVGYGDRFADEMSDYITSDNALRQYEKSGRLLFDNNNWWEIVGVDENGSTIDLGWAASGDSLYDAIEEAISGIEDAYCQVKGD